MYSYRQGFTFIELIIVIALIGVISAIFIVGLDPISQINKSKDAKRKADLALLQKVGEDFYNDKNRYADGSEICYDFANAVRDGDICSCHICGTAASSPSSKPYLDHLICDPDHPRRDYLYQYSCSASSIAPDYRINASLSNTTSGTFNHSVASSDIIPNPTASASSPTSGPINPSPTSSPPSNSEPVCVGHTGDLYCKDSNNVCNNCGTYNQCISSNGCDHSYPVYTNGGSPGCTQVCTLVSNPTPTLVPTSAPNPSIPPISK